MRKLAKVVGVVVVLFVIVVVVLSLSLGTIVEKGLNNAGPRVMGVPVSVEDVGFNALSGNARIRNLTVGNPEGFKTDYAFKLRAFDLAMQVGSVLSDKVVIDKILIDGPEITYEMGLRGNNLKKLKEQIEKKSEEPAVEEPQEDAPAEEKSAEKGGKKVEIGELVISGGRVNFSATALGGSQVPIPLPTIRLTDIGKEEDGASIAQVVEDVLAAVVKAATGAVKDGGKLIGKGAKEAGKVAAEGAKLGAEAAQKGADAATELTGKGASAAAAAAGKGTDAVADLAGKGTELGSTAAEGAGKVLGGGAKAVSGAAGKVGGLLGSGSKKLLGGSEKEAGKEE